MPRNTNEKVSNLLLDLHNYRTVAQKNEEDAVQAMVAISPDKFWALMESLLDSGYLIIENILVVNDPTGLVVKDGNRRIAALKIIHGFLNINDLTSRSFS